jgi:hypothetical protein
MKSEQDRNRGIVNPNTSQRRGQNNQEGNEGTVPLVCTSTLLLLVVLPLLLRVLLSTESSSRSALVRVAGTRLVKV